MGEIGEVTETHSDNVRVKTSTNGNYGNWTPRAELRLATPAEKKPFEDMAKKDTERYSKEKETYREEKGLNVPAKSSKEDDPSYITNPKTQKRIKRTTTLGKELVAAEAAGAVPVGA